MSIEPDLKDIAERVVKLETWQGKVALKIDTMSGGWWDGLEKFVQNHPKIALGAATLLAAVVSWATTYFSVPTRDVPGPEKVIVREVEKEPAGKSKQKADTVP